MVAWNDCAPGTKGYLYHQQSVEAAHAGDPVTPEEKADDATCRSYGTAPGSDAYVNCRIKLRDGRAIAH